MFIGSTPILVWTKILKAKNLTNGKTFLLHNISTMQELIKIKTNDKGTKVVSAKELYCFFLALDIM